MRGHIARRPALPCPALLVRAKRHAAGRLVPGAPLTRSPPQPRCPATLCCGVLCSGAVQLQLRCAALRRRAPAGLFPQTGRLTRAWRRRPAVPQASCSTPSSPPTTSPSPKWSKTSRASLPLSPVRRRARGRATAGAAAASASVLGGHVVVHAVCHSAPQSASRIHPPTHQTYTYAPQFPVSSQVMGHLTGIQGTHRCSQLTSS